MAIIFLRYVSNSIEELLFKKLFLLTRCITTPTTRMRRQQVPDSIYTIKIYWQRGPLRFGREASACNSLSDHQNSVTWTVDSEGFRREIASFLREITLLKLTCISKRKLARRTAGIAWNLGLSWECNVWEEINGASSRGSSSKLCVISKEPWNRRKRQTIAAGKL